MKIPTEWFHLFAGDRIHTTLPFHRIQAVANAMEKEGFTFTTEPSPRGYWLVCSQSPNVSPYKRQAADGGAVRNQAIGGGAT